MPPPIPTMTTPTSPLTLPTFLSHTPTASNLTSFYTTLHARAAATNSVFLSLTPLPTLLSALTTLATLDPTRALPLHAVPFVLKDNIHLPPHKTTAACPSYAHTPSEPAFVVRRLLDAGALCLGKVNMDQFATGLVGTRSPYGVPQNPTAPDYIPGGSSSGSAVAVALGLAVFALGTDTAGSGRVPAAMTGTVGVKPTKGLLSTRGVVPAAKSLDCVSIFANSVQDAALVLRLVAEFDENNVFARLPPQRLSVLGVDALAAPASFRFGVLADEDLTFEGDDVSRQSFDQAVGVLHRMGGRSFTVDFTPFKDAARLLYGGPFVAERFAAIGEFIKENRDKKPDDFDSVVANIVLDSERIPAWKLFNAQERIKDCVKRAEEETWNDVDVILLPTIPKPVTLQQVRDSPVAVNSMLGTYTNFVNLMDYCAVAVPSPAVQRSTVPRGVTFVAQAFHENFLLGLADKYHRLVQQENDNN